MQLSEKFENTLGLGSKHTIRERLSVLATKGFVKFRRDGTEFNHPVVRSRFGYLCVEGMAFGSGLEMVDPITGEKLSDENIGYQMITFLIAGHETTASMLNWTWFLLANHPEVEAKLHAEIDALEDLPEPSLQHVETLHYAHNVLREALRLYPPVWVISRRTIEPDVLGGYEVPANTDVFISPYFVHRHPQYWDDAEAFKPERFEGESEHRKLVYLPFSAGAHHCIGETLSIYEGLLHLSKAARRYRLRRVDSSPVTFEALINLRTQQPIFMRLEPRG
jgi:cytochrome P450